MSGVSLKDRVRASANRQAVEVEPLSPVSTTMAGHVGLLDILGTAPAAQVQPLGDLLALLDGETTTPQVIEPAARAVAEPTPGTRKSETRAPLGLPTRVLLEANLPDWHVTKDREKARPMNTVNNVAGLAFVVGIRIQYNVMTRRTEIIAPGLAAARDDLDNAALACLGDCMERAGMSRRNVKELADAAAGAHPYHPALEAIRVKTWDGVSRLETFHDTLVTDPAHRALRNKLLDAWMLQGIGALVEVEGIAAQGVLVLAGPQNIGKTRWVERLGFGVAGAVRTGMHLNPRDKDSVFQATSAWITELGELDHTVRHADVSALKAFITRPEDVLRRPYALTDNTYRRRTDFVGTVNGTGFLADTTGDRRFWVVPVIRCELLDPAEIQQVWAEYMVMYERGQRWHLGVDTYSALHEANAQHRLVDPLEELIRQRFDWNAYAVPAATEGRWMTATEICIHCGIHQPTRSEATRAGSVVRELNGGTGRRAGGVTLLAVPERGAR